MPHDQQKTVLHALLAHDCSPGDLEPLGAVLGGPPFPYPAIVAVSASVQGVTV